MNAISLTTVQTYSCVLLSDNVLSNKVSSDNLLSANVQFLELWDPVSIKELE